MWFNFLWKRIKIVKTNEVTYTYTIDTTPVYEAQPTSKYNFYRSTNPNVFYTPMRTQKIGELVIDTPNSDNLLRNLRITVSFSCTEITAHMHYTYLDSHLSIPLLTFLHITDMYMKLILRYM